MIVLLALAGCWGPPSGAVEVADELCRWGQLSELTPTVLPPTVELPKLVRELDLRYASTEPPAGPSAENPFLALHQTLGMVVDDPARALAEVQAKRSVCEIAFALDGDRATAHVKRTVARPLDGTDVFLRAGQIQQLASHELRVAEIDRWFAAATEPHTTEYDLVIEKHGTDWIANLGLPEAALHAAESELVTVRDTIAKREADAAELAKIVVLGQEYFLRSGNPASIKRIDITVRNDLPIRVTRVDFQGTLTSAEREAPLVDEELSYSIRGKMETGDQETFTIVSRLPPKWRVAVPKDTVLAVKVIRMAGGPTGEVLYTLDGWDEAVARKGILEEEIARLRAAYGL